MKNIFNKNLSLILIFVLPLLFIVMVGLMIYIPSSRLKSSSSFVYTTCMNTAVYINTSCREYASLAFSVVDGKIIQNPDVFTIDRDRDGKPDFSRDYDVKFFMYDWDKNLSQQITLEQALNLKLSNLFTSPDGVTWAYDYGGGRGGLLWFGTGSDRGYYATKGNVRKKLNIVSDTGDYYGSENVSFMGWVVSK